MGLFDDLFTAHKCVICGRDCGTFGLTKLSDDESVCHDCVRECSLYVKINEMTKEELLEHIEYMKRQEHIFRDCFMKSERMAYPRGGRYQQMVFCDEIGMFAIIDERGDDHKMYRELFRYDQVTGCEPYILYGTPQEGKTEKPIEEYGIKIKLVGSSDPKENDPEAMHGRRPHPFVKHPIRICFSRDDYDFVGHDYAKDVVQRFNKIFGVNGDPDELSKYTAAADAVEAKYLDK